MFVYLTLNDAMFRISARDFHGKLQMSSLGKKNIKAGGREKVKPSQFWTSHILLDLTIPFMIPGAFLEEFRFFFWQRMPLRHIFETRKC